MKPKKSKHIEMKAVVLIGATVLAVLLSVATLLLYIQDLRQGQAKHEALSQPIIRLSSATSIERENAQLGTVGWQIPPGKGATIQIQAYADSRSVAPRQTLTFYASTQQAGTNYTIGIYRLGWYQGTGGRLMATSPSLIGQAQGYYASNSGKLIGCTTCYVDNQTGLIEARWRPSYRLTIPADWTSGVYLAKFIDAHNMQTYATFDVIDPSSISTYVAVTADTTYAAYNSWGGRSLYDSLSIDKRASKVSFERPSVEQNGSDQVLIFEANAIHWLERQGYDLSYMSSVDLHTNAASLLRHKAYISIGHDEYWSKEMRDGVEQARDHGVSLAFLEADSAYWQMRFEPDTAGNPDRTIVCYKVLTSDHDLALDPLYGKDNSRVTSQWRDPVINRPENALIGIMYSDLTHKQRGYPWIVDRAATSPLLKGDGLTPGQPYGCGLVGYEWDKIFPNGAAPKNLQILATSLVQNDAGQMDHSNTSIYIAPSNAVVFASGAIYWTAALDSYRYSPDPACKNHNLVVPGIQLLMANVMHALIAPQTLYQPD